MISLEISLDEVSIVSLVAEKLIQLKTVIIDIY